MEPTIEQLQTRIKELEERIKNASIMLAGWDGAYDPETGKGSVSGLAEVVEIAYCNLQGRSWRAQ
jgi:hypothetical protein